jgi:hypothetical protein
MIHGLLSTVLVGMLGGLIAEVLRIVPALRLGKPPGRWELLVSLIMVLLGGGAALFGWDTPQAAIKVAVTGAAFPLLFSTAVGAAKGEGGTGGDVAAYGRSALDYVAGRF